MSWQTIIHSAENLWRWLGPIWGSLLAIVGGLITLQQGIIKAAAAWKWCVEKYDDKILHVLQEAHRHALVTQPPGQYRVFLPFPLLDIVKEIKRSEKRVCRSLRRLEARGKVHEVRDGWHLGSRRA